MISVNVTSFAVDIMAEVMNSPHYSKSLELRHSIVAVM